MCHYRMPPLAAYQGENAMSTTCEGFTAEEKAARRGSSADKAAAKQDVVAKIAEMPDEDRVLAERVHAIVKANAPMLAPKLGYGQPAYALDGKIVFAPTEVNAKVEERIAALVKQAVS